MLFLFKLHRSCCELLFLSMHLATAAIVVAVAGRHAVCNLSSRSRVVVHFAAAAVIVVVVAVIVVAVAGCHVVCTIQAAAAELLLFMLLLLLQLLFLLLVVRQCVRSPASVVVEVPPFRY